MRYPLNHKSFSNINSKSKKLVDTIIEDLEREITPSLKYDLFLRLNFAIDMIEKSRRKKEGNNGC
jgi:hypothetical protein